MKLLKGIFTFFIFVYALTYISCTGPKYGEPVKAPAYLLSNFNNFWEYWNQNVKLSRDFISFDENEKVISKGAFLEKLTLGGCLPLRLQSNDSIDYYKLYKINDQANEDISKAIKTCGNIYYQKYKMVDKPLPGFSFIDLNGTLYNKETCKGKIVVLNCWFIHCGSCVAEMPVLNRLVNIYKDRHDIVFVSLAWDSPIKLKAFLQKTAFNYAVVSDKENYLSDTLNIPGYPAHVILNKNGLVVNVPEDYKELEIELRKEAVK